MDKPKPKRSDIKTLLDRKIELTPKAYDTLRIELGAVSYITPEIHYYLSKQALEKDGTTLRDILLYAMTDQFWKRLPREMQIPDKTWQTVAPTRIQLLKATEYAMRIFDQAMAEGNGELAEQWMKMCKGAIKAERTLPNFLMVLDSLRDAERPRTAGLRNMLKTANAHLDRVTNESMDRRDKYERSPSEAVEHHYKPPMSKDLGKALFRLAVVNKDLEVFDREAPRVINEIAKQYDKSDELTQTHRESIIEAYRNVLTVGNTPRSFAKAAWNMEAITRELFPPPAEELKPAFAKETDDQQEYVARVELAKKALDGAKELAGAFGVSLNERGR